MIRIQVNFNLPAFVAVGQMHFLQFRPAILTAQSAARIKTPEKNEKFSGIMTARREERRSDANGLQSP
jgi:hypothetical protein